MSSFKWLSRTRSDDAAETFRSSKRADRSETNAAQTYEPLGSTATHFYSSSDEKDTGLEELNRELVVLADIFPDIRPDVFRELLMNLSTESRLHLVAEQLLQHKSDSVRGRWRVTAKVASSRILSEVFDTASRDVKQSNELVPKEELFRSQGYKNAVKRALREEFGSISRTAIEGVLVEQNYSYTNTRPILTSLTAKSWRFNLKSLIKWKKPTKESHFMLLSSSSASLEEPSNRSLKPTSSPELDQELYQTVLKPLQDNRKLELEQAGWDLATRINDEEAQSNRATFECECCFDDVAFESIAFCSNGEHQLCFKCLHSTVSAALFAQAWSKTINHDRSLVACFAPSSIPCTGCMPYDLTRGAIMKHRGGDQVWKQYEQKLATEALEASGAVNLRCPFCPYAEIDDVYYPPGVPTYKLKTIEEISHIFLLLFVLSWTLAFCWQYLWLSLLFPLPNLRSMALSALESLARKRCLGLRFVCRNPDCLRASCRYCKVAWRDPHKCNEREELDLRKTVEAARSAAMKRVCPKCNIAFVKESGCNKMTCTCGYIMCYLCRQGLGQQPKGTTNPHEDHDYSHFCGHFRALPGRCSQCNKCDLYREENQDEVVRRAGETAEREWRSRMGKALVEKPHGRGSMGRYRSGLEGRLQWMVDYLVETYVTC